MKTTQKVHQPEFVGLAPGPDPALAHPINRFEFHATSLGHPAHEKIVDLQNHGLHAHACPLGEGLTGDHEVGVSAPGQGLGSHTQFGKAPRQNRSQGEDPYRTRQRGIVGNDFVRGHRHVVPPGSRKVGKRGNDGLTGLPGNPDAPPNLFGGQR